MPRCPKGTITCGMLPTLRALASKECENSQGTICLVPFDANMDAGNHLQMILLEAYCRETGIKVLRVSREKIQNHLCPGSGDLSCVLICNDNPYFLDTPEWIWDIFIYKERLFFGWTQSRCRTKFWTFKKRRRTFDGTEKESPKIASSNTGGNFFNWFLPSCICMWIAIINGVKRSTMYNEH